MAIHPLVILLTVLLRLSSAQQPYVDNKQLNCLNNQSVTQGFPCNSLSTSSCLSFATFRTTNIYNSPTTVGYLLSSDPSVIATLNRLPSEMSLLPTDTLLIVPLPQCSCTSSLSSYQHNGTYILKSHQESYYTIANYTYEGLTTCQALMSQNNIGYLNLSVGDKISVPIRCACPSRKQMNLGFRYLLSYLVTWGDTMDSIAQMFGVDIHDVLIANQLTEDSIIFPFTPLLVPLKSDPSFHGRHFFRLNIFGFTRPIAGFLTLKNFA